MCVRGGLGALEAESSGEEAESESSVSTLVRSSQCVDCGGQESHVMIERPIEFGVSDREQHKLCWECAAAQLLRYNSREFPAQGARSIQLLSHEVPSDDELEVPDPAEDDVCTCCNRFLVCLEVETDLFHREQLCWTCAAIRLLQAHTGQVTFLSQLRCL